MSGAMAELMDAALSLVESVDDFDGELADLLRYHGRTHGLSQGMQQDWQRLPGDPGVGDDELDEYIDCLMSLLMVERPEMLAQSGAKLSDITRPGLLDAIVQLARGDVRDDWQPRDFETADEAVLRDRLAELSLAFSRWLGDRVSWPAPRVEMARSELHLVFAMEADRPLQSGEEGEGAATAAQLLVPDETAIERRFEELLGLDQWRPHRAAAFALALVPWVDFLVERGLLRPRQAQESRAVAVEWADLMAEELDEFGIDPDLASDLRAAKRGP